MRNIKVSIEEGSAKKLVGMEQSMSLVDNKTYQLFNTFMPRRKEIENRINTNILDLKIYSKDYFLEFNPTRVFTKRAVVEVSGFENIPKGMNTFELLKGTYAVFYHKGLITDHSIFVYIFTEWLPRSKYDLDDRPHFDVLGENLKSNTLKTQQEIWIPVK